MPEWYTRNRTSRFAFAAAPISRGVAARWSKPGSAKPLCVAITGGICGNFLLTFRTCWMNSIPTSESRNQPLA